MLPPMLGLGIHNLSMDFVYQPMGDLSFIVVTCIIVY